MSNSTHQSDPRVGVFVCHCGGNISDVIEVDKVTEALKDYPGVTLATHYEFMCSDPGQNQIKDAIRAGDINRVVVAACSPRLHALTFRSALESAGLNPYFLEQANIREQASWVHKADPAGATEKAIRLIKGAVDKVKLAKPLDKIHVTSLSSALVLGGGVAGLRAALDMADRGSDVHLVEKTPFLGGHAAKLDRLFPTDEDAKSIVKDLGNRVLNHERITVYLDSELADVGGGIGQFRIRIQTRQRGVRGDVSSQELKQAGDACPVEIPDAFNENLTRRKAVYRPYEAACPNTPAIDWQHCTRCGQCQSFLGERVDLKAPVTDHDIEVGILLIATGYEHYEPYNGEYGYGQFKQVITLPALIRMLDEQGPFQGLPRFNGRPVKNIGFIHCVGSRQLDGVTEPTGDRPINKHCSRVCCTATLQTANELRDKYPDLHLFDFYQDIRTYGRDHEVKYYQKASGNRVLFFRYDPRKPPVVSDAGQGKLKVTVEDLLTMRESLEVELDLLVLATGMVPADVGTLSDRLKLPRSADRFLQEVHPKLRPVEMAVGGVFLAGTAQAPGDTTESTAMASAAAVKAAAILESGGVRLEPHVTRVDPTKCKGHGECVKACPSAGAITLDDSNQARVNEALCISCGICVAVCPECAVDIQGYEIKQFEALVDAMVAE